MLLADSRAFCTPESNSPIRIAMMAMTTSSSIRVKARRVERGWSERIVHRFVLGRILTTADALRVGEDQRTGSGRAHQSPGAAVSPALMVPSALKVFASI